MDEPKFIDFESWNAYLKTLGGDDVDLSKLKELERKVIRQHQEKHFKKELKECQKAEARQSIQFKNGPLNRLLAFVDRDGLLHLESRFSTAKFMPEDEKYPMVIEGSSQLAKLLIRDAHVKQSHGGVDQTRAEVRRHFHVTKSKTVVRREVFECKHCREKKPRKINMAKAPFHENRLIKDGNPFTATGVDHFGPFQIGGSKCWGLIFTCMTTRAVHLEATRKVDATSFIMALEHFIGRRGKPKDIYCDGGTAFRAGDKLLKEMLDENKIKEECLEKWRIQFHVNPPGSPHWGGCWERLIKEVKRGLHIALEKIQIV